MRGRPLRRATGLALAALLAFAGTAMADQLFADGDVVKAGIQGTAPLGNVAPGAEVSVDVEFTLNCTGLGHVDVGQTVHLSRSPVESTPPGGAIVSVTSASIGPIEGGWAADSQGCPSPVPSIVGTTRSTVTLRAPTAPALGYLYTVVYDRTLSPANASDPNAFSRTATQVSFTLNVVGNAAPTLTVPTPFTAEGNATGGWLADWSAVFATDPEDNPDPTPTCDPDAGTFVALGTSSATCSVTDSAGATDTEEFSVTVVDTTDPVLNGMPGDRSVTTGDAGGAVVTYVPPTATDIVDSSPAVTCAPASGEIFPVGPTLVTCTATDASGNSASASFTVNVAFNAAPTLTVPSSLPPVEGNTTGGWTADWSGSGVSATDPEDDPDPAPACDPVAGSIVPLGTTSVTCSVTDSAGASDTGRFDMTVEDTTGPELAGMPGDRTVTTGNPGGVAVTYNPPMATDIVDASPAVGCSPASGETFPIGLTTVTCTATDASNNSATASFTVNVRFVATHVASAIWLEPVGDGQDAFEANHSRTIPVKVRLFVDGVERSSGQAQLTLTPCGGGAAALKLALEFSGGRWNASLDTSMLAGSCYNVSASIDGLVAGSFRLELRGETAAARLKASLAASPPPRKTGQHKPR